MDVDVKHSRVLHFYYMAFSSLLYFPFISFSVVLTMFQLALLLLQWLWTPSKDDPMMFFAITFIWGTTSASWDFLILGKRLKNSYLFIKLFCKLKKVVLGDVFFMNETREKFIIQLLKVKIRCDTYICTFL